MASTTPNMNLIKWDQPNDTFNYVELAENFAKIDIHDHSNGYGKQITSAGIAPGAIKANQLDNNSINQTKLSKASVGKDQIQTNPPAVDRDRIENLSINNDKLATDAVKTVNIQDNTVTNNKLVKTVNAVSSGIVTTTRPFYVDGTASGQYTTIGAALNAALGFTNTTYTPVTGDEIYYAAGPNVIWHLRYNNAATYKWQFIGGSPLFSASTNATEYDNTGAGYKISNESKIILPYALTGGIFDITISAYVTVTNDTNMIPSGQTSYETLTTAVRDGIQTSVAGAFISYQWKSANNAIIDAAGGTNQFAGIADFFAYNKIENNSAKCRKPGATLALTLRTTKSNNLSNSTIAFAQRRQDNAGVSDTATFDNRTVQIRPVAIN